LKWRQWSSGSLLGDEAIVWQRGSRDNAEWWALAHVFRHPKDPVVTVSGEKLRELWELAIVYDAPVEPRRVYSRTPNAADLSAFLEQSEWSWKNSGVVKIAGRVCAATWTRLIGEPPPKNAEDP
jgi:hypothetical protein